jgi:DNA-binding transcriptional ArsR family regulator
MSEKPQPKPSFAPPPTASNAPKRRPLRWFSPIPVAMLLNPAISGDAIRLFGILLHHEGAEGCFPRQDTLSTEIGKSIDTVQRLLDELRRHGFLDVEKRGRRNNYRLAPEYTAPVRPNTFEATGELELENTAPVRPIPRRALGRRKPASASDQTGLALRRRSTEEQHTAPMRSISQPTEEDLTARVRSIDTARMRRESRNTPHECGPEANKNQSLSKTSSSKSDAAAGLADTEKARRLELETALREIPGITTIAAATIAIDLRDEDPRDVLKAAHLMVKRRRFREGRVPNPSGYLREMIRSQIRLHRVREEHEREKRADKEAVRASQVQFIEVYRTLEPQIQARIREAARALCKNEQSPAWPIAMQLALRRYLSETGHAP